MLPGEGSYDGKQYISSDASEVRRVFQQTASDALANGTQE